MSIETGTVVGDRFEVEGQLGHGSYGAVFRARERSSGRRVALKMLHAKAGDPQAVHRFRREAKLASLLVDPHTVRIEETFETTDGQLVIVMEYLDGRLLTEVLDTDKKLPLARTEAIARGILSSLTEAHAAGIVHRDLNPNNIFLTATPQGEHVKVFDFGIAKIIGGSTSGLKESIQLTEAGGTLGTPQYMSPEQCRGESLTPASDMYALGIVLYECLTGDVPFDHQRAAEILVKHTTRPVPSLPDELASTSLGHAIKKSLRKSPKRRIQTAAEFRAIVDAEYSEDPGPDPDLEVIRDRSEKRGSRVATIAEDQQAENAQAPWMVILMLLLAALVAYAVFK